MNLSNHKHFKVSLKCFDECRNANGTSRSRWLETSWGGEVRLGQRTFKTRLFNSIFSILTTYFWGKFKLHKGR